jgi:hypothetical protein
LSLLVAISMASAASAQTKFSMSGKCAKPDVQQAVPAGDAPDHMLMLVQGKCAPTKAAEFGGSQSKESTFAEHGEMTGNSARLTGIFVDTLANGEKVYYHYESTVVMQNGAPQTMQNKWQIVGATAKLKGIKGQGTCSGKAAPDGGLSFDCSGDYVLGK